MNTLYNCHIKQIPVYMLKIPTGFFKMARGINECNIEANAIAGVPLNKL